MKQKRNSIDSHLHATIKDLEIDQIVFNGVLSGKELKKTLKKINQKYR